jgi:hypothetical protein
MDRFEVAHLDERIVQQIQQFEKNLKDETGHEIALVAYATDAEQTDSIGKNVK